MNIWMYLAAGIVLANLLSVINEKAREYWKECLSTAITGIRKKIENKNILIKIVYLFFYALVLVFMLVFLLLAAPIATAQLMLQKTRLFRRKYKPIEKENGHLYLSYMGGSGAITCYECGYSEKIISFVHNFDDEGNPSDGLSGYQCQICGKFQNVKIEEMVKPLTCFCSGELSRDKALFCPQCKSTNMKYDCYVIT